MIKFLLVLLISSASVCADDLIGNYANAIEKIILYKNDKFKVFYGGPIDREHRSENEYHFGVQWVMPVVFEDHLYETRAVYEIAFVNCSIDTANDAEVIFVNVSDIDIKFKNQLTLDYKVFSELISGRYSNDKYIVVRLSDASNVYFPEIFFSTKSEFIEEDQKKITHFLHTEFKTKNSSKVFYNNEKNHKIIFENELEVVYQSIPVEVIFNGEIKLFDITKRVLKNDPWKLYYIISRDSCNLNNINIIESPVLLRLDSGCVSGQVYNDSGCDCLDQLHSALNQLSNDSSKRSLIIHIPMHDGRGFGFAPKAETEIYKRGGKGRVNCTHALDTIAAANLLYRSSKIDLRTFDGAAKILECMKIKNVILLTDNVAKVNALKNNNIEVLRKKTGTSKDSCQIHINSKKNSSDYFND